MKPIAALRGFAIYLVLEEVKDAAKLLHFMKVRKQKKGGHLMAPPLLIRNKPLRILFMQCNGTYRSIVRCGYADICQRSILVTIGCIHKE